jgi:uncharacterized membrane protein YkoI
MKIKGRAAISAVTLALAFAASHAIAAEESKAALMAEAKISEAEATAIALGKVPHGVVKGSELEREHGRLIWSFDIAQPSLRGVIELQVDAKTGKIVSVRKESPAQEAKEAKAEESTAK